MTAKAKDDIYERTTQKMIELMEAGQLPWQKPWNDSIGYRINAPINGSTGRRYHHLFNSMLLSAVMNEKESADPRFFTISMLTRQNAIFAERVNHLKKAGQKINPELMWEYRIKKGAKAVNVIMQWHIEKDKQGNPLPEEEQYWAKKRIALFHASDCIRREYERDHDGNILLDENGKFKFQDHPLKAYVPKETGYTHEEQYAIAEAILEASGAKIVHNQVNQAGYSPAKDRIVLPPKNAFKDLGDYYATALHELAHWTGHESRMNREGVQSGEINFGSDVYAREELRAELASTFLAIDTGLPLPKQNHAAYLQSWVKSLKDDKMEIFKASEEARKIKNYVMGFLPENFREQAPIKETSEGVQKVAEEATYMEKSESSQPQKEKKELAVQEPLEERLEKVGWEAEGKAFQDELVPITDPRITKLSPKAQSQTGRFYKYYMNYQPITKSNVPIEGLYFVDKNDKGGKFGALYYEKQLPFKAMQDHLLIPDYTYFANKAVHITFYQKNPDAVHDKKNPSKLYADYTCVHEGDYIREGITLSKIYQSFTEKTPEGARPPQVGDLFEIDGKLIRVEEAGFSIQKANAYKGDFVLTPFSSEQEEALIERAIKMVGENRYHEYVEKLHAAVQQAAHWKHIECEPEVAIFKGTTEDSMDLTHLLRDSYTYNLRERLYEKGLSSYTPMDEKGWESLDFAFAKKELLNELEAETECGAFDWHEQYTSHCTEYAVKLAMAISTISPYAAITKMGAERYGHHIAGKALNCPEIQKLIKENTEKSKERAKEAWKLAEENNEVVLRGR